MGQSVMKRHLVSAKVSQKLSVIFDRNESAALESEDLLFFPMGRDALLYSLKHFDLRPGDCVIVPALMCFSTVAALDSLGYKLIFIDVGNDLQLNKADIKNSVKNFNVQAILAVHYFGYALDLAWLHEICCQNNILLIEDCCHNFFTERYKYEGDNRRHVAIGSLRKSLPVKTGGVLEFLSPGSRETMDDRGATATVDEIFYIWIRLIEKLCLFLGWPNIYGSWAFTIKSIFRKEKVKETFDDGRLYKKAEAIDLPWLTKKYLGNSRYTMKIRRKTTENFELLSASIRELGIPMVIDKLPQGSVPQYLAIHDSRGGLVDYLRRAGIAAIQWPGNDSPPFVTENTTLFPVSERLGRETALLPVHADLNRGQCDYILKHLQLWLEKKC